MPKSSQIFNYIFDKKIIKELYWDNIFLKLNTDSLFNLIWSFYNSQNRNYHNINHIINCQIQLYEFSKNCNYNINEFNNVSLALWFHDIIYDTRLNNNEELSAKLAKELLPNYKGIDRLILITKYNQVANSLDEKLISDIDLSILGSFNSEYKKYSKAIRLEYGWVPDYIFYKERLKLLDILYNKNIYYIDYFKNLYEKSAKENILNEIKMIKEILQ